MPNHYHLLIETTRAKLVKGMQWLNSTYTLRYNARHKQRGHLFQGRYKALLVDGEEGDYFLTVSDYIHVNPARAKMVRSGDELLVSKWNSAGWLAGVVKGRAEWLRWERVYGELGMESWGSRERKRFGEHVRVRVEEELGRGRAEREERWGEVREGWCYGSEGFRGEMRERMSRMLVGGRKVEEKWSGASVGEAGEALAMELMGSGRRARSSAVIIRTFSASTADSLCVRKQLASRRTKWRWIDLEDMDDLHGHAVEDLCTAGRCLERVPKTGVADHEMRYMSVISHA